MTVVIMNLTTEQITILQAAIDSGSINFDNIATEVDMMERKEILQKHTKIWQDTKGKWCTHLPSASGKRSLYKRNTKKEIEDLVVAYYKKQETIVSIRDVFNEWVDNKLALKQIKIQSYDRYKTDFERFFPDSASICQKHIEKITIWDIETFISATIRDCHLTVKTYQGLKLLLFGIFKHAKKMGLTTISIVEFFQEFSPNRTVFAQKDEDESPEVFYEDERHILVEYLRNNPDIWNLALLLQLQTGMRIGEISALKWCDIHDGCILVSRTEVLQKIDGVKQCLVQDTPKTLAGQRTVELPESAEMTLQMIRKINPFGEFIFLGRSGQRIRGKSLNSRLGKVCAELGIPKRSTHKMRKTYATMLYNSGIDDAVIKNQLGHSDIATTRKCYVYNDKREDTIRALISHAVSI